MSELKKCPFCGSQCFICGDNNEYGEEVFEAVCSECGATVSFDEKSTSEGKTIEGWNKRCENNVVQNAQNQGKCL